MQTLTAFEPVEVAPDTFVLPAFLPIPGLGILPMHAFLLRAAQPVLIDTGPAPLADSLVARIAKVLDPSELRYVWLTHADPDHVGGLAQVLAAAPAARVVTTFVGLGKLGLTRAPLAPERAFLLNPGQRLDLGDRGLRALRPPVYDAPETIGVFDERNRALFPADCFGTLMHAVHADAKALSAVERRQGMLTWASVDAPWLCDLPPHVLRRNLQQLAALDPEWILGSHVPPARQMTAAFLGDLVDAAGQVPFVGPDQAAVEAMTAAE